MLALALISCGVGATARTARAQSGFVVAFGAQIVSLPNTPNFIGDWKVSAGVNFAIGSTGGSDSFQLPTQTVHVTDKTTIKIEDGAQIAVGSYVEVTGTPDNGFSSDSPITATQLVVRKSSPVTSVPARISGTIQRLPATSNFIGDWVIALYPTPLPPHPASYTVTVDDKTTIKVDDGAKIAIGSYVEASITPSLFGSSGGTLKATQIEVKSVAPTIPQRVILGVIQKLPATPNFIGEWSVAPFPALSPLPLPASYSVLVDQQTQIKVEDGASIAVGSYIEVTGFLLETFAPPPTCRASQIVVKKSAPPPAQLCYDLVGAIEQLPSTTNFVGTWKVSGRTLTIDANTKFKTEQGDIKVGALVRASVCVQTDGTLLASSVETLKQPPVNIPPVGAFLFFGAVQTLPSTTNFAGDWTVANRTVHVASTTKIDQQFRPLVVGAFVMVAGTLRADGSVDATLVAVKRNPDTSRLVNFFEFNGAVESLPASGLVGDWRVTGQTVHVTSTTRIIQDAGNPVKVGSRVSITGVQNADNSLQASRIFALRNVSSAQAFVTQHYRDFLNREPDDAGLQFWSNEIASCGANASCVDAKRANASAAFFLSTEFQQTGFFVYRLYKVSFGRQPRLAEFLPDTQTVSQGVIVNQDGWQDKLTSNRNSFIEDWAQHPQFAAVYDSMSDAQYVDALYANAGVTPDAATRNALINGLQTGAETRATALAKIANDPKFTKAEFNRAFVLMQYFGYLRRNPDDAPDANLDGYNFWLNKLNSFNGDYIRSEMIRSFILSQEYNSRFGQQ